MEKGGGPTVVNMKRPPLAPGGPSAGSGSDAEDAKQRRRVRNRLSAQLHREKQRKYVKILEQQLELAQQERDALRVCLMAFLDVPCSCEQSLVYRNLASELINAGSTAVQHLGPDQPASNEAVTATAMVNAAQTLAAARPCVVNKLIQDPSALAVLQNQGVASAGAAASVPTQPQHTTAVPTAPMVKREEPSTLLHGVAPGSGSPLHPSGVAPGSGSPQHPSTDLPLPSFVPGDDYLPTSDGAADPFFGLDASEIDLLGESLLNDDNQLLDPTFAADLNLWDTPAPALEPSSGSKRRAQDSPTRIVPAGAGSVSPRPTKMARRGMMVMGFVFAIVLLGLPVMWDFNIGSQPLSLGQVHVGGATARGLGVNGGYYVSADNRAAPLALPTTEHSSTLPHATGGARLLKSITPLPPAAPEQAKSKALVMKQQPLPTTPAPASNTFTGVTDDDSSPSSAVVPYRAAQPTEQPKQLRGTSLGRQHALQNMSLIPVQPHVLNISEHSGSNYVEVGKPLQKYANAAFATFLSSPTASIRRGKASSSQQNASFVMCPEAFGVLNHRGRDTMNTSTAGYNSTRGALPGPSEEPSRANSPPYMLLLVPSSSMQGGVLHDDAGADPGWYEIGCEIHSVRRVSAISLAAG